MNEHVHPHHVPCPILSSRNTRCWHSCGHFLPHAGGGEFWNDDREDVPEPKDPHPEPTPPPVDVRQRMLEMARDLARIAVELPRPALNEQASTLGAKIVDHARQLLAALPKCDALGCSGAATHKTEHPLDRGGEWPHTCDAHLQGRETVAEETWLELSYARSLRDLLALLERPT